VDREEEGSDEQHGAQLGDYFPCRQAGQGEQAAYTCKYGPKDRRAFHRYESNRSQGQR
jgi:hypothetical protein